MSEAAEDHPEQVEASEAVEDHPEQEDAPR